MSRATAYGVLIALLIGLIGFVSNLYWDNPPDGSHPHPHPHQTIPLCPTDDADLTDCVWDCTIQGNRICGEEQP